MYLRIQTNDEFTKTIKEKYNPIYYMLNHVKIKDTIWQFFLMIEGDITGFI